MQKEVQIIEVAEAKKPTLRERIGGGIARQGKALAAGVGVSSLMMPTTAFAAGNGSVNIESMKNLLTTGITFLGGVLIIMGLVNLGLTIKDGIQGGGGQLAGAISMIIGGGIIIAAAALFSNLGTITPTA